MSKLNSSKELPLNQSSSFFPMIHPNAVDENNNTDTTKALYNPISFLNTTIQNKQNLESQNIKDALTPKSLTSSSEDSIDENDLNDSQKESLTKSTKKIHRQSILITAVNKRRSTGGLINPIIVSNLLKKSGIDSKYNRFKRNKWIIDLIIFILVSVNVGASIIDNEMYISLSDKYIIEYKTEHNTTNTVEALASMNKRAITAQENFFRFINFLCSCINVLLLVMRYKNQVNILCADDRLTKYDNIYTSGMLKSLVIEIFILGIFYPPFLNIVFSGKMLGLDYAYNVNSIFSILVIFKLYTAVRILTYMSRWNSPTAIAICNKYRINYGIQFMVKAEMKKRPGIILTFLLSLSLILLGFTLRTFEYGIVCKDCVSIKSGNDLSYLANCFWLIVTTMTTVGYGDYYPRSHLGRFVGVIACIIGMFLLSLIVVSLSVISDFTPEEKKAYSKLKKLLANDTMESKAGNILKTIVFIRRLSKIRVDKKLLSERFILFTHLRREVAIFTDDSRTANSQSIPLEEMLKRLENKIADDVKLLTSNIKKLDSMDTDINDMENQQLEVTDKLDEILMKQEAIGQYLLKLNNENVVGDEFVQRNSLNISGSFEFAANREELKNTFLSDEEKE
jgi:hypothetical protein